MTTELAVAILVVLYVVRVAALFGNWLPSSRRSAMGRIGTDVSPDGTIASW